jgi:hypothetical protein
MSVEGKNIWTLLLFIYLFIILQSILVQPLDIELVNNIV